MQCNAKLRIVRKLDCKTFFLVSHEAEKVQKQNLHRCDFCGKIIIKNSRIVEILLFLLQHGVGHNKTTLIHFLINAIKILH